MRTKRRDKPIDPTINAPVGNAIEKGDLLDDEGNEHTLVVGKKTLKASKTANVGAYVGSLRSRKANRTR